MNKVLLPYPPSTNTLYKNARRGRVKTDKYEAWITDAGWALKAALCKKNGFNQIAGKVDVFISILKPDNCKRDIDNLSKAILDLLVRHEVIEDDRYIDRLSIGWRYEGQPGALVEVLET